SQVLAAVERIEISADQSDNAEIDALDNITLTSAAFGPLAPTVSAAPAPLTFRATAGDPNPVPQTLVISSSADAGGLGTGTSWSATVDPAAAWLKLSATSGTTPSRVTVTVDLSGLAPGTINTNIRISAPGATNPSLTVPVGLTVLAAAPRISAGGAVNAATN